MGTVGETHGMLSMIRSIIFSNAGVPAGDSRQHRRPGSKTTDVREVSVALITAWVKTCNRLFSSVMVYHGPESAGPHEIQTTRMAVGIYFDVASICRRKRSV